jgi:hypothetical protein
MSPVSSQPLDETTVLEIRQKWPEMMEVTNRVASVHQKIFETSKVRRSLPPGLAVKI